MEIITTELKNAATEFNKNFTRKLVPDTDYEILGVTVPQMRAIAKKLAKNTDLAREFLNENHKYYEEWFLHGLLIGEYCRLASETLALCKDFLPHIDNWAICDSFAAGLKTVKKNRGFFLPEVKKFTLSSHPYTVRAGVIILLSHYMEENYLGKITDIITAIKSGHYYVDMGIAWLLSVMLVKFYDNTLPLFTSPAFSRSVHNKAIQKAVESRRLSEEQKQYLKTLKI